MAWRTTFLIKWLNSSLIIYILYFSLYFFNEKYIVLSSTVCFTKNQGSKCQCIHKDPKEVQCLVELLENLDPCYERRESYKLFCEVMSQFDCQTKYSVRWNCSDCLDAYTKWLLEVIRPSYVHDHGSKLPSNCTGYDNPSSTSLHTLCNHVLARCPYFAPQDSYGDTPAFICPGNYEPDTCNSTATKEKESSST